MARKWYRNYIGHFVDRVFGDAVSHAHYAPGELGEGTWQRYLRPRDWLAASCPPSLFSLQRLEALKRLKWEDDRGWHRPGSGKALQTTAPDSVGGKCPKSGTLDR